MKDNIKEFEDFKNWCKERKLKPSHATSLELYMKEKKEKKTK